MKALHASLAVTMLVSLHALAAENKVPSFEDVVEFTADPVKPGESFKDSKTVFKNSKIDNDELKAVLSYTVVTREQWLNGYSHVAMHDRTGTITMKDKTKIRMMVRPGGLATLTFPDGAVIYLAQ